MSQPWRWTPQGSSRYLEGHIKYQSQNCRQFRPLLKTRRGAPSWPHYTAEAEALRDRVAILVSGRLSKSGKDYLLEVKRKEASQGGLSTQIVKLFPQAAGRERYCPMMPYKLPMEDVHPLSQTFFK
ncbi:Atp-Binding Cassette Sub-Family A Member 6 [Manis pentadactyla]|nr:Atp-Binding Cassette Sub-Family A Member 6 [Manis pentadactyla]